MKDNKLIIRINKSVDEIFAFVTTPPNSTCWISSIAKEKTSEWPAKIGTVYRLWDENGNYSEMKVAAIKNNELVEWISEDKNYHCRYILKIVDKNISEFEYYEWVDQGTIDNPFTQDTLEKLKSVVENHESRKLIVSVCRGNIARSAVAEKIIENELCQRNLVDKYLSISRGIQGTSVDPQPVKFPNITYYEKLYEDSKPILQKLNIDLSTHTSTPIEKNIAKKASILLAMDKQTKQALLVLFPAQEKKVHMFSELINKDRDIVDPEGVSGPEKQEKIFTEIQNIIIQGFQKLLSLVI